MQCQSCFGNDFEPSGDGRLVCTACGEELQGFQEEEMDANLAGVTMMNRHSQSSQAYAARQSQLSKRESILLTPTEQKPLHATDQVLICEGVFIYLKALSDRLVQLKYVSSQIYKPLFQIAAHWVGKFRVEMPFFSTRKQIFAIHQALSMVCLAAVYIRSPLLPRDICRLVATQQVPYLAVLKTVFPPTFRKPLAIRIAFTPKSLPIATSVITAAIELATDNHAWPPVKALFESSSRPGRPSKPLSNTSNPEYKHPVSKEVQTAFPVGHTHLTLLRITRLLGLPDTFGARVVRWIGLRTVAMDWWHKIGMELNSEGGMADDQEALPQVQTDESMTADVVNSLRLCYGRRGQKPLPEPLLTEWNNCKQTMDRWLRRGTAEDLDTVSWTSLSTNTLTNLQGRQLERYVQLVDDVLTERGEAIPELWGPFVREFQEIARSEMPSTKNKQEPHGNDDDDGESDSALPHVHTYKECMYDETRCGTTGSLTLEEGLETMECECGHAPQSTIKGERAILAVAIGKEQEMYKPFRDLGMRKGHPSSIVRNDGHGVEELEVPLKNHDSKTDIKPGRSPESDAEVLLKSEASDTGYREDGEKTMAIGRDWYPLWEPVGIGLAWTIINKFFNGCNVEVEGMVTDLGPQSSLQRVRAFCDRAMQITMKFVDYLEERDGFLIENRLSKKEPSFAKSPVQVVAANKF